jgi:hypothetical protein
MKLVLRCRSCNKELSNWVKPVFELQDALDLMKCTSCDTESCDLFVEMYNNANVMIASIDEPMEPVEPVQVVAYVKKRPWWRFWR